MSTPKKAVLAVSLATLLFGRQIASWTDPKNRYLFHWQTADALALAAGIALLALALFVVGITLARSAWARQRRLHEVGFLAALIHGLLAQIQGVAGLHSFWLGLLLWGAILAGIVRLLRRGATWPLLWAERIGLILSPLVLILALQIFAWPTVDLAERGAPGAATTPRPGRPPIVLLIFDEWSWQRTEEGGEVRASLPALAALARRSLVVREALSPGDWTWVSLPSLLFASAGELELESRSVSWAGSDGTKRPTRDVPSLLDLAERHGYQGRLLGYYFPYRDLLGSEGELIRAHVKYPKGKSPAGAVGQALFRNLEFWSDPISQLVWEPLDARFSSENWREVNLRLRAELEEQLAALEDGVLLVAHMPMPHSPFIFDRQGNYLGPYPGERSEGTPEQYEEHLHFADRVLGEMIAALERADRFDRALLIFTSDHSWRHDVAAVREGDPQASYRVPLVIKWPEQQLPLVDDRPFCTVHLASLVEAALAGAAEEPLTAASWEAMSAEGRAAAPCAR